MPSSTDGGLTPDDQHASDAGAQPGEHPEHDCRAHAVGLERRRRRGVVDGIAIVALGLDHCDRPGRLAHRERVDEHERVVPVEQLVREVHAADAEVDDLDARRAPAGATRRCATSTPNASSPKKMLPMPATSTRARSLPHLARRPQRLELVGLEVQVAALPREHVGRGVVVERDRDVHARRRRR